MAQEEQHGRDYFELYDAVYNAGELDARINFIKTYLPSPSMVLDACCGHGRVSHELANNGFIVTGMDSNEEAINQACTGYANHKVSALDNPRFIAGDILENPLSSFDAITLLGSLPLFQDPYLVISTLKTSLRDNGILIFDVHNRDCIIRHWQPEYWAEWSSGRLLQKRSFNIKTSVLTLDEVRIVNGSEFRANVKLRLYTLTEILDIIQKVGFSSVKYFGGFNDSVVGTDSSLIVVVAKK